MKNKKQYAIQINTFLYLKQNEFPGLEEKYRFVPDNGAASTTLKAFEKKYSVKIIPEIVNSHIEHRIVEHWTKRKLITWLRRYCLLSGRLPGRHLIMKCNHHPDIELFYKKFGSLADAYRAAGLLKGAK